MVISRPLQLVFAFAMVLSGSSALHSSTAAVQARIDQDHQRGAPVVVHVVVALCDNEHQGIVPVPATLGNGQDPRNNLYWGALYGVRTQSPAFGLRAGPPRRTAARRCARTRRPAARAYDTYQKCGPKAARWLFHVEP